jgi:hypothetical protein
MSANRRDFFKVGAGVVAGAGATMIVPKINIPSDHSKHHIQAGKTFDPSKEPQRIRKSFYDLTDDELRTFMKAVGYMRNNFKLLDARQWDNYAKLHALHCTEADDDHPPVHWSWHFLPWHRGYLYFLERILAYSLDQQGLDGSKFALPYWDWTVHKKMPNTREREEQGLLSPFFGYDRTLENMVSDDGLGFDNSALYDGNRGPTLEKSDINPENELTQDSKNHVAETLNYMSKEYVELMLTVPFEQFGGKPVTDRQTGQGLMEQGPHNDGHDWIGTRFGKNRTMGTLRNAAADPMFYMHHGNIDRIWTFYRQPQPDPKGDWGKQQYNFLDVDGTNFTLSIQEILEKTTNVSYAPSEVEYKFASASLSSPKHIDVGREIYDQNLVIKLPETFSRGRPILIDIQTGPIRHTGKYVVKIYSNKKFVGKLNMLDGEHRKTHTKDSMTHSFSVLMANLPSDTREFVFVPPKHGNIKLFIKNIQYREM